ncbi:MAG: response regulator [Bacteroidales bacterium]
MKVLTIDDNPLNLKLLSAMLEPHGHQVLTVSTPASAVSAALEFRPDIILLDIAMPGRDGIQVMHDLRARQELKATPIHALTALAMEGLQQHVAPDGFTSIIRKPCGKERLLALVEDAALG